MFNIEEFDLKLDTEVIGRNFVYCQEVDSTNSVLMNYKEYGEDGTVLLSEFQTNGRGRKDRKWDSNHEQNLLFSILVKGANLKPNTVNLINFASAL